jgi:hypothetical protein
MIVNVVGELPGDASTLIYIAKADGFATVARCVDTILVAPGVWRESVEDAERLGYPDAARIRTAEQAGSLRRVELSDAERSQAAMLASAHRLGLGESEVLAITPAGGYALVDEGRASRVARTLGLRPISSLFLPILGRRGGKLAEEDAMALLRALAIVTGVRADVVFALEKRIRKVEK